MMESGETAVPAVQNIARLLYQNAPTPHDQAVSQAAERVFEAVRSQLSVVLGASGYATLLARALSLARAEFAWLSILSVDKNGSLTGVLGAASPEKDNMDTGRGFGEVLLRFAGLLETFIGDDLTNRLLETVWQDLMVASSRRETEDV